MPKITAPGKKPVVLNPVHPNQGIAAGYQKRIDRLISDMHASILYWISAAYRANPPTLAQDASPASDLRRAMKGLVKRWQGKFDEAAPKLAEYFATAVSERTDGALSSILKDAGFSVEFKMTETMRDVMQATIGEQVGLIKSIASEHLSAVEGLVMRSVTQGRDLATLTDEIEARYGVTRRRAVLIARDQNNKATATITRVRQSSLGITKAIWVHSAGGKEPRPEHLKAGRDKLVYDIAKGAYLDDKWVWPGTEINCRCTSRSIIPGLDD